jgi:hypothetical protein
MTTKVKNLAIFVQQSHLLNLFQVISYGRQIIPFSYRYTPVLESYHAHFVFFSWPHPRALSSMVLKHVIY